MEKFLQEIEARRGLELDRRLEKYACRNYAAFFRAAWYELEPVTPLHWNWHIQVLCDELQKQAERIERREKKKYDIIINIPPGTSKSTISRRLFIPWVWTRFPGQKFITASYDKGLSLDHAVDSRTLIQSQWYQRYWGKNFKIKIDQNVKSYFKNDLSGFVYATSVGSASIGRRCDWEIIDDPNDPKKDESEDRRMGVVNWFFKVMYKRLNNPEAGLRVIVQQRTHENDLTGYLLQNFPNDYKLFLIPGEESDDISPPELRKYYKDGLFDPVLYSKATLADDKKKLGPDYSGQIMQRPSPDEGNIFKKQWWRFWVPAGMIEKYRKINVKTDDDIFAIPNVELPLSFEDKIISWDMGLKGKSDNDYSVGQVWGKLGPNTYLIDQVRGKFDSLQCEIEAKVLKNKYPDTSVVKIEEEAAGSAVIARMGKEVAGVSGFIPHGSKRNRARNMASAAQSGNIILPHPDLFPWVNDFIEEYAAFDKGVFDDQVDAGTQAHNHFILTRRVFAEYTGGRSKFVVGWAELSNDQKPIIAQYCTRSGQAGIVIALHNRRTGIVRILANALSATSNPEEIKDVVEKMLKDIGAKTVGYRTFSWFGNDAMFSKAAGDMAEVYMTKRIYVREIPNYNEPGAILSAIRRIVEKRIIIHERAEQLAQEMLSWTWKNEKEPDSGHYLARALCMVCDVSHDITQAKQQPQKRDYSQKMTAYLERLDRMRNQPLESANL